MTVVTETLDLANGATPRGASVYFRLAGTGGAPVEGTVGSVSIVGDLSVTVLANGSYSVDLYGNDVITPSGTRWKRFVVLAYGPNPDPVYINVPSAGGPYAVDAILDEAPASVASSALTLEIAARIAGDATNATAVTTEATSRATADSVLAAAITAETSRATTAEALKLAKASNLSDVANAATALANIGGHPVVPTAAYCDQTGATDAAVGLRLAAAAAQMSNLPLFISPGSLLVDSLDVNSNIVTLTQGVEVSGAPGATIKLGPNASHLRYVFGPAADEDATDLSGLDVHDIIFDGSKATTPVDATNAGYHRNCVGAFNGDVLKFHDNVIKNWDGRQLVTFDGRVNGIAHVYYYNNVGIGLGGPYYHDASAFYVDANYVTGYGNHVVADIIGSTTPSNAGAAYEIHGHCVDWHDNSSENYQSGGNLVSTYPTGPQTDPSSYKWHDNVALNCASAVNLWPLVSMTDVDISRNMATISVDQWPTTGTNGYPNVVHVGVNLVAGNASVKRCRIDDNDWVWLAYAGTPSIGDVGVSWTRPTRAVATADTDMTIRFNRLYNCPSTGIYVQYYFQLARWDVSDNKFYNVGKGGLGENYQAGMVVKDTVSTPGSTPFAIDGLKFNRNTFTDDQGSHTLSYPLILSAGTARTDVGCTTTNASGTILDASSTNTDLRAVVTGTGIPANAVVTSVVPGVSFNINPPATASGSADLTLTGAVGLTRDVEALDNTLRIADGTAIRHTKIQTTQTVDKRTTIPSGRRYATGMYYTWDNAGADSTLALVSGTAYLFQLSVGVPPPKGFQGATIEVTATSSSSTIDLAVYADDGYGKPAKLILDFGAIDSHSANAVVEAVNTWLPDPGLYWIGCLALAGTPTVRSKAAVVTSNVGQTTGGNVNAYGWTKTGLSSWPNDFSAISPSQFGSSNCPKVMVHAA